MAEPLRAKKLAPYSPKFRYVSPTDTSHEQYPSQRRMQLKSIPANQIHWRWRKAKNQQGGGGQ